MMLSDLIPYSWTSEDSETFRHYHGAAIRRLFIMISLVLLCMPALYIEGPLPRELLWGLLLATIGSALFLSYRRVTSTVIAAAVAAAGALIFLSWAGFSYQQIDAYVSLSGVVPLLVGCMYALSGFYAVRTLANYEERLIPWWYSAESSDSLEDSAAMSSAVQRENHLYGD